eukprot:Skav205498  [mRNA]  locus=scaffold231:32115:35056:- [translate_table: standard]
MIRTHYGPVGLRQPRDPESIKPASSSEKKEVKIFKQWLTKNRKEIKAEQYRSIVKQTMLLAAAKMEVNDIAFGAPSVAIDEKTGLYRSPDEMAVRDKLAKDKDGTAAIPEGKYWAIQSGIMKVYRTVGPEYTGEPHRLYDVREATCKFETRDMDVSEVKSWERAIRMCKYLLNATDREAQSIAELWENATVDAR